MVWFQVYEVNRCGRATGYKVMKGRQQVGTLEYRDPCWEGGGEGKDAGGAVNGIGGGGQGRDLRQPASRLS